MPPSIKGGNVTSEVTALLHNPVTLECEVRGVPLPAITWYKNGESILSSRQVQYVDRGHFLKLSRVQVSDAGRYICRVTSVAGTAEKVYMLDVYGERSGYFLLLTFALFLITSLPLPILTRTLCYHIYHSGTH